MFSDNTVMFIAGQMTFPDQRIIADGNRQQELFRCTVSLMTGARNPDLFPVSEVPANR